MKKLKAYFLALSSFIILAAVVYYYAWGQHLYLVTAYCDCPICINVPGFRDGQFASGVKTYWGGAAADPHIPFKAQLELVPVWPSDFRNISRILDGRKNFQVEDRGGKIKGKHIDIFIPQSMGGHRTALQWGRRKMRIKLNGNYLD